MTHPEIPDKVQDVANAAPETVEKWLERLPKEAIEAGEEAIRDHVSGIDLSWSSQAVIAIIRAVLARAHIAPCISREPR